MIVPASVLAGVVGFTLMEPATYAAHRWVMHGIGWSLHRSHHRRRVVQTWRDQVEANDWFPVIFAGVTVTAIAAGTSHPALHLLVPVAAGVTAYGAAYAAVHDVYIHGRFAHLPLLPPLERLRWAHGLHHRYGGEPYGMLCPIIPRALRERADARPVESLVRRRARSPDRRSTCCRPARIGTGGRAVPDVILPVLDERAALPGVLASLPPGFRPIVVDNGSTDGSAQVAADLGATVVVEPRRGFGAACFAGLSAATAEIVCFMDCDGSLDGGDLPLVAGPVLRGEADLVLGRRVAERGSWPLHARLGNRVLARRLRRRCGLDLSDLGPMRAARRVQLLELGIVDRRFGWPLEMVVRAADARWRVCEVPVPYHLRTGRSKVTGTVRGTLRTVRDMSAVLR